MNEQPPSEDALKLAAKLNGHETHVHSQCAPGKYCQCCKREALIIDAELQLPQRNAALLCAQGVSDWYERGNADDIEARMEVFGALGQALANIKSKST